MAKKRKKEGFFGTLVRSFRTKGKFDAELFVVIVLMLMFGLVMVASASSVNALRYYGDSMFFLKKQLIVAIGGFILMLLVSKVDYHIYARPKFLGILVVGVWLLMLATALFAPVRSGARRWIDIGPISFQPSELGKIVAVLLFATLCSKQKPQALNSFKSSCVFPLAILVIFVAPVLLQRHKSATLLIGIVCGIIVLVNGARLWYYLMLAPFGIAVVLAILMKDGYSLARLQSWFNPFSDIQGDGWQAVQSLYAIGSGGLFGLGLGRSRQKYLYIPEPQNDFIFAIICEELGFIGAALVVILFIAFLIRGIKIAVEAPDKLGTLTAIGFTALIMVQVVINIAVVTGVFPVTGMPLPFFSAGGTSLAFTLVSMGILLNISRQSKRALPARAVTPPRQEAAMRRPQPAYDRLDPGPYEPQQVAQRRRAGNDYNRGAQRQRQRPR